MAKAYVQVRLPASIKQATYLRRITEEFLVEQLLPKQVVYRMVVVMDELFMNAVEHGSRKGQEVSIDIQLKGEELAFIVRDMGRGSKEVEEGMKNIKRSLAGKHVPKTSDTSGRGICMIVKEWTDSCKATKQEEGICMKVTKDLSKELQEGKDFYHLGKGALLIYGEKVEQALKGQCFAQFSHIMEVLQQESPRVLCLQLSGREEITRRGAGRLVELGLEALDKGWKVEVSHASEKQRKMFEKIGIYDII